jgi:hypothetical protein
LIAPAAGAKSRPGGSENSSDESTLKPHKSPPGLPA